MGNRFGKTSVIFSAVVIGLVVLGFYFSDTFSHKNELLVATTTSLYDSGLLDEIIPDFEERFGADIRIIAAGTGQALELGRRGDADVLLVHAPEKEIAFMEDGYGLFRKHVMHNEFLIVGPRDDPAGIRGLRNAPEALRMIFESHARFASRGDDSGTHANELDLWNRVELNPESFGEWYLQVGQGMGDTLRMTNELKAYTLTDEGTWYALNKMLPNLIIAVSGDLTLVNLYSVIPVDDNLHVNVNSKLAVNFSDWITSKEVQEKIGKYEMNGHQLFTPIDEP